MTSEVALYHTLDANVCGLQVLTAALGTAALFGSFSAAALLSRRRRCAPSRLACTPSLQPQLLVVLRPGNMNSIEGHCSSAIERCV